MPVKPSNSRNALRYILKEARNAGIVLSNAFVSSPKKRGPTRYVRGIRKGNFYKKKLPPPRREAAKVPKIPPMGPQTMPQPLIPVEHAAKQTTSTSLYSRIYDWWKQNAAVLVLNFGSLCTLVGFTKSDVLELRAYSMTGSLSSVAYFLLCSPIRWAPVAWSSLFATVNGVKIYNILYERNAHVILTEHEQDIFVEHFMPSGVTPKQFELVMKKAKTVLVKKGDYIVKQGDPLDCIYLVVKGKTRAQYMGRRLTAVSDSQTAR